MTAYITTKEIVRLAGIGVSVTGENLGTGDNSEDSFDLKNGNVVDDTYTLYYGASGSNSFTNLTESTHYSIDLDKGSILLTSAGVTALGTNVLYADYTHSPKISNTDLIETVSDAESEVESLTGNYWGEAKTTTEIIDGREQPRYPYTNRPYVTSESMEDTITLKYKGVNSITQIDFLENGTSANTLESTQYGFDSEGTIVFYDIDLPLGKKNVQIEYIHGYTSETRPREVKKLAGYIGAITVLVGIGAGSYDDFTSFTVGRKGFNVGEVYVNIREAVRLLQDRANRILKKLGEDLFVC